MFSEKLSSYDGTFDQECLFFKIFILIADKFCYFISCITLKRVTIYGSVIKRPTDSTRSTTSGQTSTKSGQTSTTSGQTSTTSGQTSTTSN